MTKKPIGIERIRQKENVRSSFKDSDIARLMESIRQDGLLQPIGLVKTEGDYTVVWGHRRFEAIKKLGWSILEEGVHCIVVDREMDYEDFLILNTIENIQRRNISPIELGAVVFQLHNAKKMSFEEISARLAQQPNRIKQAYTTYLETPMEHRANVGYKMGAGTAGIGKIPPSTITYVATSFPEPYRVQILNEVKKHHWGSIQLKILRLLLAEQKLTLEQALSQMSKYRAIYVELLVRTNIARKLEEEHKKPISNIIRQWITQGIRPKKELLFHPEEAVAEAQREVEAVT